VLRRPPGTHLRLVAAVRAALPLLSLGAVLALACAYSPPAPCSGDRLLDALLKDLDRRGPLPWQSAALGTLLPNHLMSSAAWSVLGHLDERFTNDPRYWQLLYLRPHNVFPLQSPLADLTNDDVRFNARFLEEAQCRGAVDRPLLIGLLDAEAASWTDPGGKGNRVPQGPSTTKWPTADWAEDEEAFARASAGKLDPLLRELLRVGHDDAAAYYVAARYESERGDYPRAAVLLAQGNRQTQCSGFTIIEPAAFWHTSEPLLQSPLANYVAFGYAPARPQPNYIRWKRLVQKLALRAAQRGDREGLEQAHLFACRFGQNGAPVMINNLVGDVMCGIVSSAMQSLWPRRLSPLELNGLAQLAAAKHQISAAAKIFNQNSRMPDRSPLAFWITGLLSCGQSGAVAMASWSERDELQERNFCTQTLAPLWQKVQCFDYRTMHFSAAAASISR
jgi:hypothetical protein